MKFNSILVANRGEIASRIIKTSQKLGLKSIAVYVDADKDAPFVKQADEAIKISDVNELGDVMISDLSGFFESLTPLIKKRVAGFSTFVKIGITVTSPIEFLKSDKISGKFFIWFINVIEPLLLTKVRDNLIQLLIKSFSRIYLL